MSIDTEVLVELDRFWLPLGRSYSLTHAGWLAEPVTDGFFVRNGDVVPTVRLAEHRCLVLLGEPGIGKSKTVLLSHPLVEDPKAVTSLRFDLGSFSSEDRLARRVFEDAELESWRTGNGTLCLTLDGFDEARARIETLPRLLCEYLDDWDCERLFLRIVCRTADWPTSLRSTLAQKFGDVALFELLPLRRTDARTLLEAAAHADGPGRNAEEALAAVEAAHLVPLAARPLTLELLRAAVGADGSFPVGAADLYARGLLALADETTSERRDAWQSRVPAETRVEVAARLAAISVFGGRPTVWLGTRAELGAASGADSGAIVIGDATSPPDGAAGVSWPHTAHAIQQTVRSGLFTGAGENRVGWAHATFPDYLATRWILDNGLSDEQVRSLLLTSDERVHVRVRQVAAWLVRTAPARFGWLVPLDPEAFLANVDIPDESLRRQLVDAVFQAADAGNLFHDHEWNLAGLAHPTIADQLRDALHGAGHDIVRIAISVARHCGVTEIVPDLTAIALDGSRDPYIRVAAAMGVYDLSDNEPTDGLVTLIPIVGAVPPPEDELPAELEGAALMASWPHAISTEKVFDRLNPRHARNFSGIYSMFVHDFARGLGSQDLGVACDWLTADSGRLSDSRLESLVNAIICLCVKSLDDPRARNTLRTVAQRRSEDYAPLFGEEAFREEADLTEEERRAVSLVLLEGATEHQVLNLVDMWGGGRLSLIQATDFAWLVTQYEKAPEPLRTGMGAALKHLHNPLNTTHSEVVLSLADDHPVAGLFTYWRTPVELDSAEAAEARSQWSEIYGRREERRRRATEPKDAWVNPRIIDAARGAADGDIKAFWNGVRLVTVRPGTERYFDEFKPDLSTHARWATLPEETRQQFVWAAPIFLTEARCEPEAWLGQDKTSFVAVAAYRAMILLLREHPEALAALDGRVWREWAPILIDWSVTINGAQPDDKQLLLSMALPHASDELQSALVTVIDKAIQDGMNTFHREELTALMSDGLADKLLTRLRSPMAAETRDDILDVLMGSYANKVALVLRDWLHDEDRAQDPERARTAVLRLLQGPTADAWPELRDLMDREPEFIQSALAENRFVYDHRPPDRPEADLADLYIWVCHHFPITEDPQHEDAHIVGPREALATWRDGLLETLKQAGTAASVEAIEHIVNAFPERTWLVHTLALARRALREQSWAPLSIDELDKLAGHPARRIVRTDADLIAVTVEALSEIQARLQGDTPTAHLLWDTHSGLPKSEEHISDYLADELTRRLNQHGIVVNREVQVRRSKATSGLPERTDLRIEAVTADTVQPAAVLVLPGEVKGNWNRGVITSIQTQLVDRYMADLHTDHGLYIVAWFDQDSWTATDDPNRKRASSRWQGRKDLESALETERAKQETLGRHISVVVLDFSLRRPGA